MAEKPTKSPVSFLKPNESNNQTANGGISNAISNLCRNFSSEQINTETNNNSSSERTITTPIAINTTNCIDDKSTIISKISNCDCTNISIMHLFHEMKQEFPTIPDQIVAKHVNENCHQREHCLELLRTELALHPSPVQAYPAKALQQLQQQQQLPKKPPKPLRKSPVPPSLTTITNTASAATTTTNTTAISGVWPITYSRLLQNDQSDQNVELNNDDEHTDSQPQQQISLPESPRLRPTTLNLFPLPQQQQFRNVQVQLKEQLQQRNQQQQQQHHQKNIEKLHQEQIITMPTKQRQLFKPVRKAPLPPLPPKPTHLLNMTSPVQNMQQNSNVKVSPTTATTTITEKNKSPIPSVKSYNNLKSDLSPVRHRAVLNMNPHKPIVRTFISNSTPTSPVNNNNNINNNVGQKSFTSVNLTLRQPVASIPQSTIDIVAGPGVSAAGGSGLTYSSTSYNALHGYQKTFNITVSDEGSEISASRIRSPNHALTPTSAATTPSIEHHRFVSGENSPSQENSFKHQLSGSLTTVCDYEDFVAILELQKARRDKLAAALRENKKKLLQMEQKINILTEPVCPEETTKLDNEIQQLRTDCESMLNEIEFVRRLENNQQITASGKYAQQRALQPRSTAQRDNLTPTTPSSGVSTPVYSHQQNSNAMQQHHLPYLPTEVDYTDSTSEEEEMCDDDDDDDNDGGNDDEGVLEMWACNMCTFRNHPQLNICECCENVRILPALLNREDISITLSAGENTIIHSWIVS